MTNNPGSEAAVQQPKLYGLDFLRALAIVLVFVFHYSRLFPHPSWTEAAGKFGWTGVDLFFVLSGYLISSQLFAAVSRDGKVPLRPFFLKRFFRIIPPYAAVLAIYFLLPSFREREGPAPLWKYLTFTQNLGLDVGSQGTFSHAWSLCIEEQFYLCLPLLLAFLVYKRMLQKGSWQLLCIFLLGFAARLYSWYGLAAPFREQEAFGLLWYKWVYYPTYCRLDGLLAGVAVAALYHFKPAVREKLSRYGNLLLMAGLLVLLAAWFVCRDELSAPATIFGFPLVALGYGLIVCGAVSPSSILYRIRSGAIKQLAVLSYSIYLIHKITTHLIQQYGVAQGLDGRSNLMMLLSVVAAFLGALLLRWIVEKPFMRLRDKLLASHKKKNTPERIVPENDLAA